MGVRSGNRGNNRIVGTEGERDIFRGFSGRDNLQGNDPADHDAVDYSQDYKHGGHHGVKVNLSGQGRGGIKPDSAIDSFGFRDKVSGIVDVIGTKFADVIHGSGQENVLSGGAGQDLLNGHAANDRIIGGLGADKLYGGADADTFVFGKVAESTALQKGRDTIYDFSQAEGDRIALAGIDANSKVKGNQEFSFIGNEGFHHHAGELRYGHNGTSTIVSGDVNGDGKADFAIVLKGHHILTDTDFVL